MVYCQYEIRIIFYEMVSLKTTAVYTSNDKYKQLYATWLSYAI